MDKFYLVSASILPEVIEKVVEAQSLLRSGKARRICEAVKAVGISRGTFYKYKDSVFPFQPSDSRRKAIINLIILDRMGVLSTILTIIARLNCNVLAINQTIPINQISNVVLTLDVTDMKPDIEDVVAMLSQVDNVTSATLISVE